MIFIAANLAGSFSYHGATFALEPLTPPAINPNHILVATSGMARAILNEHQGLISSVKFDAERIPGFPRPLNIPPEEIPAGSRILLLRAGGIGDLIMLTPALKVFNQRLNGRATLLMSTFCDYAEIFDGLVDRFLPYPATLAQLISEADYIVEFNDARGLFDTCEMTDYYLDCLAIAPDSVEPSRKKCTLPESLASSESVKAQLDRIPGPLRVLYVGHASDRIRCLPERVLTTLARKYPEVSFVVPGATETELPNVHFLDTSGGLSDFVTAVRHASALVSTDSAAYHIAAAFDVPAMVFFGPIGSEIRASYYPKVVAVDPGYTGQTCSSPCGISTIATSTKVPRPLGANGVCVLQKDTEIITFAGQSFAYDPERGCPEACATQSIHSPCLLSFSDEEIITKFKQIKELIS